MSSDARLAELELKFTEQAQLLEELSQVIYRQQQQLDALAAEVAHLGKRLEAEPGLVDATRDDKPPHY